MFSQKSECCFEMIDKFFLMQISYAAKDNTGKKGTSC